MLGIENSHSPHYLSLDLIPAKAPDKLPEGL